MSGGVMSYAWIESPIGRLLVAGDDEGLRLIAFPVRHRATAGSEEPASIGRTGASMHGTTGLGVSPGTGIPDTGWVEDSGRFKDVRAQLDAYFAGRRKDFTVRLAPEGTPFQLRVWAALRGIPYGETISYAELAKRVGNPKAVRAVGAANGRNPLPIVVPCHRVVGADGSLVGFGGGLDVKRALLDLERQTAGRSLLD